MGTNIKTSKNRIIFDGHSDDLQTCGIITQVCKALSESSDFKCINSESGYAEFELKEKPIEYLFAPSQDVVFNIYDWYGVKITTVTIAEPTLIVFSDYFKIDSPLSASSTYTYTHSDSEYAQFKFLGVSDSAESSAPIYSPGNTYSFSTGTIDLYVCMRVQKAVAYADDAMAAVRDWSNAKFVPTTRTVNGKALTGNISITASDISGLVTSIKINGTTKTPSSGVIDIGTVITSHQDISGKVDRTELATVATTGNYSDLSGEPQVETAASGGTTKSLVTTGEKYSWNNKVSISSSATGLYGRNNGSENFFGIAYSGSGAWTIPQRDGSGNLIAADPSSSNHVATKNYVDTGLSSKANSTHTHAGTDITSGIINAARLPECGSTASGILNQTTQHIAGEKTFDVGCYGAYWNDLIDSISVPEDTELEYGYCYCFDGGKYIKSERYCQKGIIGIHSDTSNFGMGKKEGKSLDCSVAGFVLSYIDKEYPVGTPLTCSKDGYLTRMRLFDRIIHPERIVATYWKKESNELYGSEKRKINVNGRHWVKIK